MKINYKMLLYFGVGALIICALLYLLYELVTYIIAFLVGVVIVSTYFVVNFLHTRIITIAILIVSLVVGFILANMFKYKTRKIIILIGISISVPIFVILTLLEKRIDYAIFIHKDSVENIYKKTICTEKLTNDQLLRRALINYWDKHMRERMKKITGVPYSYYILSRKVDSFEDLRNEASNIYNGWDSLEISTITKRVGSGWHRKTINDFKDVNISNSRLNNSIKYEGDSDRFYPKDCCRVYEKNNQYFIEIKYVYDSRQFLHQRWDKKIESYLKYKTDTCEISNCGDILKSTCITKEQKQ